MMRLIKILPVTFLIFFAGSCKKSSYTTPDINVNFTATLTGASETPANTSTATGSATGVFNSSTKILTVTTTYAGLTVTAGHIHNGVVGVSGTGGE